VIPALEFLKSASLGGNVEIGRKAAVIGGGNVAIDTARTALRQGAEEVMVFYRRSRAEMPAYASEVHEAEAEGVKLHFLVAPTRILGEGERVAGLECAKMELGKPDESGRRRPLPIKGSSFVTDVDTVIPAVGQSLDFTLLPQNLRLTTSETVAVDSTTLETNLPGVFAGGDAAKGEATVIDAIADGKRAARSIHRYLRGEDMRAGRDQQAPKVDTVSTKGVEKRPRQEMPLLPLDQRTGDSEVELGFTEEMTIREAERCLACGGCSECLECERACELTNVIDHNQQEKQLTIKVGGIIVAVGSDAFDAALTPELGYTRSPSVISNLQFERLSNAAGPTHGKILLPESKTPPKSVAFVQCVGSRDKRFCEYCCRIGCMVTLKQAIITKEKLADDVEVYVCYNDMRAFGKGYEEFYDRARRMGVKFVKGLPSEIKSSNKGVLRFDIYESNTNKLLEIQADLVVLASGLVPSTDLKELTEVLHIPRSADGFLLETHPKLRPLETSSKGIFLAGACQGPKDIPDTVAQASGAAMKAAELLATGEVEIEPLIAAITQKLCSGCRICETICPYQAIEIENAAGEGAEKKVAKILPAVCQGCGACAVACPTQAIDMQHFTREQILAQIRAATHGGEKA
jgi:heterodisulfide reductase subunit A